MKELTCIVCPNGCTLYAEETEAGFQVAGNLCRRGEEFAITELTNPVRTVCSTVATAFPRVPVIPVRVSREIPKERIFDVMEEINKIVVSERVEKGAVLMEDVLGLGADIIVTSSILSEQE
ncbi:DUF1667 domain-containing protein [Dorea sp. D27]|uniref:DUF1667 domain-containing protein n=1 Tax=Dorea sp. D27 TaxID=658665 RepID=UPI000673C4A4|nr:DUF1667 domain-containing protein [Dorea sp. D27]KMZ55121.1 hypothetical protein HMPREF0980_00799 [Dorea sp. D27]